MAKSRKKSRTILIKLDNESNRLANFIKILHNLKRKEDAVTIMVKKFTVSKEGRDLLTSLEKIGNR